jgi:hypothetical protein
LKLKLSTDPPKWKVIIGFLVIVLTDLYAGIGLLTQEMTTFELCKTIALMIVHALILGFIFMTKEEEPKPTE